MKLERLQMKHFKQYIDEIVVFDDGLIAIVGKNGSGKSTKMPGILFAL